MNIIVKIYGTDLCVCRPDTSWEKENRDLYMPDETGGYHISPILFARICKAGRRVSYKFAERYYDAIGYGALLYDSDLLEIPGAGFAAASSEDHTSILPFPLYNPITLGGENRFVLKMNGKTLFETGTSGAIEAIKEAICLASSRVSLRIGDIVAVELAAAETVISRKDCNDASCKLEGFFCENPTFDFRIFL
ncbi:MAG: hypothetical protein ACI4TM_11440 [Candidatus Cryptobacteroides sp.]